MSTGNRTDPFNAAASFQAIAADPERLRSFLACIGDEQAPSRQRAAALLSDCESVADVGCGPAVMRGALDGWPAWRAGRRRYVGADTCRQLLDYGAMNYGLPLRERPVDCADPWVPLVLASSPGSFLLELDGETFLRQAGARSFDGVLLRHVLEHLQHPHALFGAALEAARRRVVVVLSQASRAHGIVGPLMTDRHLGAMRWSHWRPQLVAAAARAGFVLADYRLGPPDLVVREELLAWEREA